MVPLMILLAVEALVFTIALYVSGLFTRLDTNDRELFDKQVQNRARYLENYMDDAARAVGELAQQISYTGYAPNTRDMITVYMNRVKEATGAAEIFLLTEDEAGSFKDAAYYRMPMEAYETHQMRRDDLSAAACAYWGVISEEEDISVVCTVPLVSGYGAPYGVVGLRLTQQSFAALLPADELLLADEGSYMLCMSQGLTEGAYGGEMDLYEAAYNGNRPEQFPLGEILRLRYGSRDGLSYTAGGEVYYAATERLMIYGTDTPFASQLWYLVGCVETDALLRFSTQIVRTLTLTMVIMMLTGVLGTLVIGRRITRPIRKLSEEVVVAREEKQDIPHLSITGISEIDEFAGAITSMSRDMIQQKSLEKQRIEHERDYDVLTGLLTRSAFLRECARIFATPDLVGCAAMLMIDLDDVKEVNDNYGHDLGDAYIRMAAHIFRTSAPDNALLAKVAGDEFYILYYGFESRQALEEQIDILRDAVSDSSLALPEGMQYKLMVTGGIAWYPEDGANHLELMRLAEFATYQMKGRRKGQIADFDRYEYARSASAVKQYKEFEQLIERPQLATYYFQPIFDAFTGEVHAYEALMRVDLPHLKRPAEVLELARHNGRLLEIEYMTWNRSLECYEELLKQGLVEPDALLFINSISSLCLTEKDVAGIVGRYGSLLSRVVIEITESEHMDARATERKRLIPGFSGLFALDDYGSGYNSERTLLELTPKYIKVDLSIIRDIDSSPDKQRIVSNIVRYAHERRMLIVAEGIETEAEMLMVRQLGVDLLQGHYLAHEDKVPHALSKGASDLLDHHMDSVEAAP